MAGDTNRSSSEVDTIVSEVESVNGPNGTTTDEAAVPDSSRSVSRDDLEQGTNKDNPIRYRQGDSDDGSSSIDWDEEIFAETSIPVPKEEAQIKNEENSRNFKTDANCQIAEDVAQVIDASSSTTEADDSNGDEVHAMEGSNEVIVSEKVGDLDTVGTLPIEDNEGHNVGDSARPTPISILGVSQANRSTVEDSAPKRDDRSMSLLDSDNNVEDVWIEDGSNDIIADAGEILSKNNHRAISSDVPSTLTNTINDVDERNVPNISSSVTEKSEVKHNGAPSVSKPTCTIGNICADQVDASVASSMVPKDDQHVHNDVKSDRAGHPKAPKPTNSVGDIQVDSGIDASLARKDNPRDHETARVSTPASTIGNITADYGMVLNAASLVPKNSESEHNAPMAPTPTNNISDDDGNASKTASSAPKDGEGDNKDVPRAVKASRIIDSISANGEIVPSAASLVPKDGQIVNNDVQELTGTTGKVGVDEGIVGNSLESTQRGSESDSTDVAKVSIPTNAIGTISENGRNVPDLPSLVPKDTKNNNDVPTVCSPTNAVGNHGDGITPESASSAPKGVRCSVDDVANSSVPNGTMGNIGGDVEVVPSISSSVAKDRQGDKSFVPQVLQSDAIGNMSGDEETILNTSSSTPNDSQVDNNDPPVVAMVTNKVCEAIADKITVTSNSILASNDNQGSAPMALRLTDRIGNVNADKVKVPSASFLGENDRQSGNRDIPTVMTSVIGDTMGDKRMVPDASSSQPKHSQVGAVPRGSPLPVVSTLDRKGVDYCVPVVSEVTSAVGKISEDGAKSCNTATSAPNGSHSAIPTVATPTDTSNTISNIHADEGEVGNGADSEGGNDEDPRVSTVISAVGDGIGDTRMVANIDSSAPEISRGDPPSVSAQSANAGANEGTVADTSSSFQEEGENDNNDVPVVPSRTNAVGESIADERVLPNTAGSAPEVNEINNNDASSVRCPTEAIGDVLANESKGSNGDDTRGSTPTKATNNTIANDFAETSNLVPIDNDDDTPKASTLGNTMSEVEDSGSIGESNATLGSDSEDANNRVEDSDGVDGEVDGDNAEGTEDTKVTKISPKSGLDDQTLQAIKAYINNGITQDFLEEEEVTSNAVKTSRYANERTRYRQNVLEGEDEMFYAQVYREEESYAIANEFFKSVTTEAHQKVSDKMDDESEDFQMDKRTLNWLKKAAGLVRPYDPVDGQQQQYFSEEDETDGDVGDAEAAAPRRMTRGLARSTRVKRREERIRIENQGLTALLEAIGELESERGPFVEESREGKRILGRKTFGRTFLGEDTDDSISIGKTNTKKRRREPSRNVLVARLPSRWQGVGSSGWMAGPPEIKLTRILVNGKHVEASKKGNKERHKEEREKKRKPQFRDELLERPTKKRRSRTYLAPPSSKRQRRNISYTGSDESSCESISDLDEEEDGLPEGRLFEELDIQSIIQPRLGRTRSTDPISLDMLDWRRRMLLHSKGSKKSKKPDFDESRPFQMEVIPSVLADAGMERRLPRRESLLPRAKSFAPTRPLHLDPIRKRRDDDHYASCTSRLLNCLSGGGKRWAQHEFFYSDIDRGWYSRNEFVSDVTKLGVLPNVKLTRSEWSVVRRHLPKRPRRFSNRFIFEELKKRNRHRSIVRSLQRNPEQRNPLGCSIPAPIRAGSTVTAYNKRLRIIHRGTVLLHDIQAHRYLVQFERKELGFEFCPDTEVASHGVPECLLDPPTESRLNGSTRAGPGRHVLDVGTMQQGTKRTPADGSQRSHDVTAREELCSWLRAQGSNRELGSDRFGKIDLLELAAERDSLVSLMATIETATKRKSLILKSLETFHSLFSQLDRTPHVCRDAERHYAWLVSNLEVTNNALDTAVLHMQVLYGKAYSKTPSRVRVAQQTHKRLAIDSGIREHCRATGGKPTISIPWATKLILDSHDVGHALACELPEEELHGYIGPEAEHVGTRDSLQGVLGAAASLLFTADYCCESAGSGEPMPSVNGMGAALSLGLETFLDSFDMSQNGASTSEKDKAADELKQALHSLKSELDVTAAKRALEAGQWI